MGTEPGHTSATPTQLEVQNPTLRVRQWLVRSLLLQLLEFLSGSQGRISGWTLAREAAVWCDLQTRENPGCVDRRPFNLTLQGYDV